MFSTSSPTVAGFVSVVASTIVKGTDSSLARVCASRVFPVPVGPINMMFDLVSSDIIPAPRLLLNLDPLVVVVDGDGHFFFVRSWPMTYSSRNFLISCGVGRDERTPPRVSKRLSSAMMSFQTPTHSSQMKTVVRQ